MPVKKQSFTIIKDKMVDAIDVDDSRGRSVPINMNFIEEGYLSKDTGCELFGATETLEFHSLFNYRKKDGTNYILGATGTQLKRYNTTTNLWENLRGGAVTMTIATPAVFTRIAHGFIAGNKVVFSTTGALPTGIVAGTTYFVIATGLTADAFQVSATLAGTAIDTTGTQSGVHTVNAVYTEGARFGFKVYDDLLYFCNAVENYTRFDGTVFTEYAAAPKGNIIEIFEDRLFVSGVLAEPLTAYYSNVGVPITFTGADIIKPIGTDKITGLVNYFGALLIFKSESIYRLTFIFDQVVSLFVPKLEVQNGQYGACSRTAISWVENDIWFFTGLELRSIGYKDQQIGVLGVNDSVLSDKIKETLAEINETDFEKVVTFYYNRRFYLTVPLQSPTNNVTFVCHLLHGNAWTKYTSRIKAQAIDYMEIDGKTYSAKSVAPFGVLKWNDSLNDNAVAIPAIVRFEKVEDTDFSRFNIYRYLDLMFKDLNARITVTLLFDLHDKRLFAEKTFLIGLPVENEENSIAEVPVGHMLIADSFGQVNLTSPFLKKRISFLSKNQAIVLELYNDKLDETFTISQFAFTGFKQPRKQFSSENIISMV